MINHNKKYFIHICTYIQIYYPIGISNFFIAMDRINSVIYVSQKYVHVHMYNSLCLICTLEQKIFSCDKEKRGICN